MNPKFFRWLALAIILSLVAFPVNASSPIPPATENTTGPAPVFELSENVLMQPIQGGEQPLDPTGIQRLVDTTGAKVTIAPQTGAVQFIRFSPEQAGKLSAQIGSSQEASGQAAAFFAQYGSLFGIRDARTELSLMNSEMDLTGASHLAYQQVYQGVPVFAGIMRVHLDKLGRISAVNGVFVPDLDLNTTPALSDDRAAQIAMAEVDAGGLEIRSSELVVFRTGLAQGVAGVNYLVYEVEVVNDTGVREFVFVDAHNGKIVDRFSAATDAIHRRIYNLMYNSAALVWEEGDPDYTGGDPEVINVMTHTKSMYDLISNLTGGQYLSYDGKDAAMEGVANYLDPNFCPNASWNGAYTRFCTGVSADDIVAHEWGHGYTEYTHGLIYQWQPGALNESYSDIFGEVVDLINGTGKDSPDTIRTDGACSIYSVGLPAKLVVNAPASIAGNYDAGNAAFGPPLSYLGLTGEVVLANDGVSDPSPTDACEAITNDVTGKIALIDRGKCDFTMKVKNAQNAGAIGVIVANLPPNEDAMNMGGSDALKTITIPSLLVGSSDGLAIKNELNASSTVNATLTGDVGDSAPEDSYRWLMGEDSTGLGGALRDLWAPNCYENPERMTDAFYHCDSTDQYGVHVNSGVGNHTFALLVDGGTYNGQTVTGIGLTKAIHIYWRAQSVYQLPVTGYADHADALEAACSDLAAAGTDLPDPATGDPSGEIITAGDCAQVAAAVLATELRTPPDQCNSTHPLLDPTEPDSCPAGLGEAVDFFTDTFESDPADSWTVSTEGVFDEFVPIDWEWVPLLPNQRTGHAFFSIDSPAIGDCKPGIDDQSGLRYLDSPEITIPEDATYPRLRFTHYVAAETGWDGGNVWIKVNGGDWQLIAPEDFTFNPYNLYLRSENEGNTNPLAEQPAFSGTNEGEAAGSWGESQVYLKPYAQRGDKVQIRFAFGNDGCNGVHGWYVDDVSVYHCSTEASPTLSVDTLPKAPQGATLPYTLTLDVPFEDGLLGKTHITDVLPEGVEFAGGLTADVGSATYLTDTNTIAWEIDLDLFAPPTTEGKAAGASRPEAAPLEVASIPPRMKADAAPPAAQLFHLDDEITGFSTSFETDEEILVWGVYRNGEQFANTWRLYTDTDYAHSGQRFLGVEYDDVYNQNESLFSPDIYIPTGILTPTLEFWAMSDTRSPGASVRLIVVDAAEPSPEILWDMIAAEDWQTFAYRPVRVDLSSYAGKTVYFVWNYYGKNGAYFFLDDVRVYGEFNVPSQATLRFNATLTAEQGEVVNTAQGTVRGEKVSGSARTEVALLDLTAAASGSKDTVLMGETFTYTFVVANEGEAPSSGATLTDTLPAGVTFVSASEGCAEADGLVTCQLAKLNPGEKQAITLVVNAPETEGEITNMVEVVAQAFEADTANNQASVTTQVIKAPVAPQHTLHIPLVRKAAK